MGLGLAACSSTSTPKGPAAVPGLLHGFAATHSKTAVLVSEALQPASGNLQVYIGTGTLDRSNGAWYIEATPPKVKAGHDSEQVLLAGGTGYMRTPSVLIVLTKTSWVAMGGTNQALQSTPMLALAVTPSMAAAAGSTPGIAYKYIGPTTADGEKAKAYSASVSATAALQAIEAAGSPAGYREFAADLFDGRKVTLFAYVALSGAIAGFGFSCAATANVYGVTEIDYVTTASPGPEPVAPATGVVSLAKFDAALTTYNKTHT